MMSDVPPAAAFTPRLVFVVWLVVDALQAAPGSQVVPASITVNVPEVAPVAPGTEAAIA